MDKKILVVDDDSDILEPMSVILKNEGYIVDVSSKGNETFYKIDKFKPDLIILDILMSGTDGRTICKKIKQDKRTKDIPVIMMSAHPGVERDSNESGADDFLEKPFDLEDLILTVKKYTTKN